MSVEGAASGAVFHAYLERVLLPELRRTKPDAVLVMDNLDAHKTPQVRELLDGSGFAYRYLPSYSPDLSPIEPAWAQVKAELRRVAARRRGRLAAGARPGARPGPAAIAALVPPLRLLVASCCWLAPSRTSTMPRPPSFARVLRVAAALPDRDPPAWATISDGIVARWARRHHRRGRADPRGDRRAGPYEWGVRRTACVGHLAPALGASGDRDAALAAAAEAVRMARANDEPCWEAAALHALAEARHATGADPVEVAADFFGALDVRAGSTPWLSSCAPPPRSAARAPRRRAGQARDLLAPLHGWFTEGLETPDLAPGEAPRSADRPTPSSRPAGSRPGPWA